ncbi:MAG: surface-adhesin E family protein [Pseudomonadota bacterium]
MKKLPVTILLTLMSIPLLVTAAAAPRWSKVGSDAGSTYYIDKASMSKTDKGHKAWSLTSYAKEQNTPDGKPYLSMKALHAYSCDERTSTLMIQVYYAEAMGKGAVVQNFKYEKFSAEDIVPESGTDSALQVICRVKK